MSLSEQTSIDQVGVAENGVVSVRTVTIVVRDSEVIASSYHRIALSPGEDVSNQPINVQAICASAWTNEVVSAYQENLNPSGNRV